MIINIFLAEPSTRSCKKIVIAFTASLSATKSIGSGAVVPFDKVWTNEGKGFDPNTGIFTAPRKGFYQISATTMSPNGKYFHSYLMKNNEKTVGMYPGQGHHTGAANIVLKLKKEDRVYIKHRNNTQKIYKGPNSDEGLNGDEGPNSDEGTNGDEGPNSDEGPNNDEGPNSDEGSNDDEGPNISIVSISSLLKAISKRIKNWIHIRL
ncbi:C1QL [Mytilus edulis]|uniref:C1QL n=1 Tax=Mytilus edulis TaxID=6550 RepID=A0A8S3QCI4_MYTED|nr:C1QL [Mytilus edulis]